MGGVHQMVSQVRQDLHHVRDCCAWAQAPAANPYAVWSRAGPGRHAFTKPIIIITDVEAVKPILGPNHADFKKDPWTYSVFRYVIACPCTHVCSHMRTL